MELYGKLGSKPNILNILGQIGSQPLGQIVIADQLPTDHWPFIG